MSDNPLRAPTDAEIDAAEKRLNFRSIRIAALS